MFCKTMAERVSPNFELCVEIVQIFLSPESGALSFTLSALTVFLTRDCTRKLWENRGSSSLEFVTSQIFLSQSSSLLNEKENSKIFVVSTFIFHSFSSIDSRLSRVLKYLLIESISHSCWLGEMMKKIKVEKSGEREEDDSE